jgi:hypothetical protein
MQDIKAWMLSKDYKSGLELYRKYGTSKVTLVQLEAAEHSMNRQLLRDELASMVATGENEMAAKQYTLASPPAEAPTDMHPDIAPYYKRKAELYRDAGHLHAIDLWSDNEAVRKTAAIAIMEKMDENGVCWDTIRYYEKHGMLPNKVRGYEYLQAMDAVELMKLRNNNRAYISKMTKKIGLMSEQDEAYRAFQNEIERRTNENKAIEALHVI